VVAGATERVALGTSVLVLPMREPLLTAKTLATLDVLSAGRLTIAVGSGWWREEFEALGQQFQGRGARFDDQLDILRAAWTTGTVTGRGSYDFAEVTCRPRPVQPGGPKIWIGGLGPTALQRTVRIGDGWHAVGSDIDSLRTARARLDRQAAAAGRDPRTIEISTSTGFGRSPEQALDRLLRLRAAGVDQVVLNIGGPNATAADICRGLDEFAAKVRPALEAHPSQPVESYSEG
jgi:probable F420-dependent oxidoreductase